MSDKKKASIIELEDLRSIYKLFSKNWYIILLLVFVSSILSYFYTYKLADIYAVKAQILLKSDDQTYDYQNQMYKGLGFYQPYQDNDNQIRVLTSNDLIKKALSKLKMDISYFIVGRLKTKEVYQAIPFEVMVNSLNTELYEQKMNLKILNGKEVQITYKKNNKEIVRIFPFDKKIVDIDFIITIKKNDIINDKTILTLDEMDYLVQIHDIDNLTNRFKNALSVETLENTSVLELSLEDEIPERSVSFVDTLSKVYIDYTAQAQIIINENTQANIDKQLSEITDILNSLENELENYKSNKSILNLDREEGDYFAKLMDFDRQRRDLILYEQSLDALQEYILTLADKVDKKLLPPSFYIQPGDEYMSTALKKIYSMQMDRNDKLFGSTEKNRNISELDQNLELLRKNILTYILNSKKGLSIRIDDFRKQIEDLTKIIKGIPKTQRNLLVIQRKVDVNERMYEYLLEKRVSTIIARSGILPQTSIIEKAHSIGIVKPDKRKIFYTSITIAIILGFLIAFIRTVFFNTIEDINELKQLTSLPILGDILFTAEANANYIIVDKDPKAAITESFRGIRTNLEYMASNAESKVVLITSYNPGEGKTFCSVNLATILAKAGKKVLLLELDLHKPKVQKALNMKSDIGVSTILIGKTNIEETILATEIENLSVILSGPTPPNASEIILSNHLEEMFVYGRNNFDYVIVDTAPIGLITDALVIMKNVDISLFVLNTKYAKKHVINIANEIVEKNKLRNFGFILNGVKRKRSQYYYNYGYGYGNSYGYGYGGGK
jgi:capsular exopolysaccharide synthesis family protein